uniref:Uncharacterized protein n=1 Tax=Avena sativa TaxID=4498 RepID=A0ACD5VJV6_AVESA
MVKHILSGKIHVRRRRQQQQPPPPKPTTTVVPPRQQDNQQEKDEEEEEKGEDIELVEDEPEPEHEPEEYSNSFGSYESFSTISMPAGIGHMTEMQVLSHVEISADNFDKLIPELEQLQKLSKLGVVLHGKMEPHLHKLLRAIENLGRCLQSLSIWFKPEAKDENANNSISAITLPMSLQAIKLSGFRDGLPCCVLRLSELVKVTLRESSLKNSDLRRLGQLANLSSLSLMFIGSSEEVDQLVLQRYEYQNLKFLVLKQTFVQHLSFQEGAAPRLESLLWTNSTVSTLSGINHPRRLRDISFSGSVVSDSVRQAIAVDPRSIHVVYSN